LFFPYSPECLERDCLKNGWRASGARVSVALNSDRRRVFCSCEPLVGSRFEAHFDFPDSLKRRILGSAR
jgi:hypothetical protein